MGTTSAAGVQRGSVQRTHLGQVPQTIFYKNWPMGLMLTNTSQPQWDLDSCPAGQTFNKLHECYG